MSLKVASLTFIIVYFPQEERKAQRIRVNQAFSEARKARYLRRSKGMKNERDLSVREIFSKSKPGRFRRATKKVIHASRAIKQSV